MKARREPSPSAETPPHTPACPLGHYPAGARGCAVAVTSADTDPLLHAAAPLRTPRCPRRRRCLSFLGGGPVKGVAALVAASCVRTSSSPRRPGGRGLCWHCSRAWVTPAPLQPHNPHAQFCVCVHAPLFPLSVMGSSPVPPSRPLSSSDARIDSPSGACPCPGAPSMLCP